MNRKIVRQEKTIRLPSKGKAAMPSDSVNYCSTPLIAEHEAIYRILRSFPEDSGLIMLHGRMGVMVSFVDEKDIVSVML